MVACSSSMSMSFLLAHLLQKESRKFGYTSNNDYFLPTTIVHVCGYVYVYVQVKVRGSSRKFEKEGQRKLGKARES